MTKEQENTIKELEGWDFFPTWGFDGAMVYVDEKSFTDEHVIFYVRIFAPCFDCYHGSDDCEKSECEREIYGSITQEGHILCDGNEYDNVEYFISDKII